jgi:hypothetical protein
MDKNILIYNYDYSILGLTLEGEFFISSILVFQTYIKSKSKRDFLLQYEKTAPYSLSQIKLLIKKYATIIYWDGDLKRFRMENKKWALRKSLIERNGFMHLIVPPWLFNIMNIFKLNFTQLYIMALVLSYFYDKKKFNWANETIARKLDMVSGYSITKNINKLQNLGLIEIIRTNRTNILNVTDKFLLYENKSN